MASLEPEDSPTPRKPSRGLGTIANPSSSSQQQYGHANHHPPDLRTHWVLADENYQPVSGSSSSGKGLNLPPAAIQAPTPLTTANYANRLPTFNLETDFGGSSHKSNSVQSIQPPPETLPVTSLNAERPLGQAQVSNTSMQELLAQLSEQQLLIDKQKARMNSTLSSQHSETSSATTSSPSSDPTTSESSNSGQESEPSSKHDEVARLKRELEIAQERISQMEEQTSARVGPLDVDSALTSMAGLGVQGLARNSSPFNGLSNARFSTHQHPENIPQEPGKSTIQNIWASDSAPSHSVRHALSSADLQRGPLGVSSPAELDGSAWRRQLQPSLRLQVPGMGVPLSQDISPVGSQYHPSSSSVSSRPGSAMDQTLQSWPSSLAYSLGPHNTGPTPPITPVSFSASQFGGSASSQNLSVQSGGAAFLRGPSALSPMAAEFTGGLDRSHMPPWGLPNAPDSTNTYMNTTEPMNYRRLLDRNMSCNWKYIVDKIVHNNDQQASIFLQQKLKVSTPEQKHEIVQAIIDQAYPLMINRFGNFLVQRCFEHGSPEQIIAIARAIRGNTLSLSMDAFGCHVVQKAFDYVPEEYKAIMVHELLRRIPETVIHRYACHVWQKLFELRWRDSPPQIMKYVNEALRGMWHEVALGETGSLVVQNIFENCLEEDKRPCITEVLASIDVVAHGQFGNWCIQHICEHGSIPDRTRATDHVLRFATEYSMDQYASKVVEKCLKIGGSEFLDRYLDRVCEARVDRPRMPLIDIAGDQFGNYLVQYIFTHADPQRREVVAAHIRKHMVSLRGSKYGSRVAMLCCNPSSMASRSATGNLPPSRSHATSSSSGPSTSNSSSNSFLPSHGFHDRGYGTTGRNVPYGHDGF